MRPASSTAFQSSAGTQLRTSLWSAASVGRSGLWKHSWVSGPEDTPSPPTSTSSSYSSADGLPAMWPDGVAQVQRCWPGQRFPHGVEVLIRSSVECQVCRLVHVAGDLLGVRCRGARHPLPRLGICTPDEHRMTVHTAEWQINLALRARIGRNAFAVCTLGRGRLPNMIVNMNTG